MLIINNIAFLGKQQLIRQYSLPTPLCYMIENIQYTKGIDVQQINISGKSCMVIVECRFIKEQLFEVIWEFPIN